MVIGLHHRKGDRSHGSSGALMAGPLSLGAFHAVYGGASRGSHDAASRIAVISRSIARGGTRHARRLHHRFSEPV